MKPVFILLLVTVLVTLPMATATAQSTTVKLPTGANTSDFTVTDNSNNVLMKLFGDGGFYLLGNVSAGTIPLTGAGARMTWYPKKSAFRAGQVDGTQWDDVNIGIRSMGLGFNPTAKGAYSIALGTNTSASGDYSTALGGNTSASAYIATAMGKDTRATGGVSTAMGDSTTASGYASTAGGFRSVARGDYSVAIGYIDSAAGVYAVAMGGNCSARYPGSVALGSQALADGWSAVALGEGRAAGGSFAVGDGAFASNAYSIAIGSGGYTRASGWVSTAIGECIEASGDYSTALGHYVSTNGKYGSCIIGDCSTGTVLNSAAPSDMTMRFAGGYRLFTDAACTVGVTLGAGGNGWSKISDSTKKTNFVKADGEYFLNALPSLRLGSWNYKTQDPATFRHYGPMAQEIFHYFGKDTYGTIGNDTTLCSGDMEGIMMVCLQALEKRTTELRKALDDLKIEKEKLAALQAAVEEIKSQYAQVQKSVSELTRNTNPETKSGVSLNASGSSK